VFVAGGLELESVAGTFQGEDVGVVDMRTTAGDPTTNVPHEHQDCSDFDRCKGAISCVTDTGHFRLDSSRCQRSSPMREMARLVRTVTR